MTLIFPEDTIITGKLTIHFFVSDLWILDYALYGFSLAIVFMVFTTFGFIVFLGLIRFCIEIFGGEVPSCFNRCIRPIVYGYDNYVKKKVILERMFSSSNVLYAQTDCAICLEPFVEEEQIAILRCHHVFHTGCISEWVNKKDEKSILCPVCKHDMRDVKAVDDRGDAGRSIELTADISSTEAGGDQGLAIEDSVMDLMDEKTACVDK